MALRLLGRRIEAAIFDLDGVLAPTLANHVRAYREALAPLGVPVEHLEVAHREGQRSPEIIAWLAERHGRPLAVEEAKAIGRRKNEIFRSLAHPGLYADVVPTLEGLRSRGLRLALGTGTHRANVPHVLGEVARRFDAVVAAEDVVQPKPHPEVYLKAAASLGVAPERALVIENAPLGVASGLAAGAIVVALTTTLPAENLKGAHCVVGSLTEAVGLLEDSS